MAAWKQFMLLLWKNYLLQKRQVLVTLAEIGLPTMFGLILVAIRQDVTSNNIGNATTYPLFQINNTLPLSSSVGLPWTVAYTPKNNATQQVMNVVAKWLSMQEASGFETESDLEKYLVNDINQYTALGGIVFTNYFDVNGTFPREIRYKIRLSSAPRNSPKDTPLWKRDLQWHTGLMFPKAQSLGPRQRHEAEGGSPGYYREGFLTLQHAVDRAVTEYITDETTDRFDVRMQRFFYPPYIDDPFILIIQQQLPLILMLSLVYTALNIVRNVVHEKEYKLKESMKMMGLSNWLHWTAWFVKDLLFLTIGVGILVTFFCIKASEEGRVLPQSNPAVVFTFVMVYAINTICYCFTVSVFFSKANSGAAAGGLLFFALYIPYFFLKPRYFSLTWKTKIAASLLPNTAMSFGSLIIGMYEGTGVGIDWSNINTPVSVDDNLTLLHILNMLLIDSVICCVITWYVEAVWPGEFGVPKPWYFPILKSYWCGTARQRVTEESETTPLLQTSSCSSRGSNDYFEEDPSGVPSGICIHNLSKEFRKDKIAVNDMTLNMYEGQITALLGHNGAEKTTTVSMLTGLFPPSSGSASVNGFDIATDIKSVRNSLGICPQHDILFDNLTVEEHLIFFCKLKGYPAMLVQKETDRMLAAVGLEDKRHALAKTLSGGMKRKLSVGLALTGGSKVVMLDEPTSGMDPAARRFTWNLLQQEREGRTILLTTHFMDEADLLGDRIAIMASGQLQCCGSSLFLKKKYGAGYHMVIVKNPNCDVIKVTNVISSYVPNAEMETNIGAELSYVLPSESSPNFERLFTQIGEEREHLGISSYGISVTTMEEVFIRVGELCDSLMKGKLIKDEEPCVYNSIQVDHPTSDGNNESDDTIGISKTNLFAYTRNSGAILYVQQFVGMFLKRMTFTLRSWKVMIPQLIVPLILVIVALVVIKTWPGPKKSVPLEMTTKPFGKNTVPFAIPLQLYPPVLYNISQLYKSQFEKTDSTALFIDSLPDYKLKPSVQDYVIDQARIDLGTFNSDCVIGAKFSLEEESNETISMTAYWNNQPFHGPGISLAAVDNAMLKHFAGQSYKIITINHPLPQTSQNKLYDFLIQEVTGFEVAFNLVFGMAFLSSSFVLFLIKERAVKSKHIQFVSGVHASTFWISTFIWDLINFCLPTACILVTFKSFNIEAYADPLSIAQIALLFFVFAWASLPFMYLLSLMFTVPSTGFVRLTMFNILSGLATLLAVQILEIPNLDLLDLSRTLEWTFLVLIPNYCLGQGLLDFYNNYEFNKICSNFIVQELCKMNRTMPCCPNTCGDNCIEYNPNMLGWANGGIGRMLVFMSIQGLVYFLLLFLMETNFFRSIFYSIRSLSRTSRWYVRRKKSCEGTTAEGNFSVKEDEDVTCERNRIATTPIRKLTRDNVLVLDELSKYYGSLLAVDRLSFGVPQAECFGLLGINGAGKTTTFKMMTGDETLSSGAAYLDGFSIHDDIKKVQQRLGYCPQFDALIDHLTGRETLHMFARLRGVPEKSIPQLVTDLMDTLLLSQHADQAAGTYSGGNKRKLSTAISLVGDPPVVFLDEPSTGMDPVARRLLWDTLAKVRAAGRCIILTSHSMEECEALCTRLAIMVNGQFKCLGSPQHLKTKFGQGYTLMLKVSFNTNTSDIILHIQKKFKGAILKDKHQGFLHFHIPAGENVTWAKMFAIMEESKVEYNVEDYSISQTTLEQVFLNFAKSQRATTEDERP